MPKIAQYTNPIDKIQPSEIGADAWNRAAPRLDEMLARTGSVLGQAYEQSGTMQARAYYEQAQALRQAGSSFEQELGATRSQLGQYDQTMRQQQQADLRAQQLQARQAATDAQAEHRVALTYSALGINPGDATTTSQQGLIAQAKEGYMPTRYDLYAANNPTDIG